MKTLADIRAMTRKFIDEMNDTTPVTWQNSELNQYINDGQKFLLSEMMRVNPDYNLARATTPCVSSQGAYVMPADLFGNKFRGLWCYSAANAGRTEVVYKSNDTIMRLQHISGYPKYYTVMQGSFMLSPVPDSNYTLEMWYAAQPTTLSQDGDNCQFEDEEVEAIAAWAAIKALNRIGRDTKNVEKILGIVTDQIKANISQDDNLVVDYDPLDMG